MIELDAILSNADWAKRTPDTLEHIEQVIAEKSEPNAGEDEAKLKRKADDGG